LAVPVWYNITDSSQRSFIETILFQLLVNYLKHTQLMQLQ